ncbi:hypothetical protein A2V68_00310 [candidate division Kazan bacterium RBG_13_50_9]|uniref:PRC-barrel domain-containing protein n=1 Tax=candidate division Kazan bacterium RBG_13_50_9 TaxID=1798535 RepID=A0A1F4NRS7_UNCK3|nr:MAG: hypothetical protein A2V68_00310 [candidate division Kazan bacterium RBG_13_50_9]
MLKPISEIVGAKLVDWEDSQTIGEVTNWVIDPDRKKISALIVKLAGLWRGLSVVTTIDVVEYGPGMVIVRNANAVVTPGEVAGLPQLLKTKHHVIQSRVETQSGKLLGKVEDLLFETTDSTIQKLYIKPSGLSLLSLPDLVVGADKIARIEPRRIVVFDDAVGLAPGKLVSSEV